MKRFAFTVRGRVQGVGFRWFTQRAAAAHGVGGWVRNEPDGTVHGEAEADELALLAFCAELRRGPRLARVDELVTSELPPLGERGFAVRG